MCTPPRGRVAWLVLAAAFLFIGTLSPALGQVRPLEYVRVFGHVQWIAAQKMLVVTECPLLDTSCTPVIVDIDLVRLSPSDYRGIRSGSWVTVEGVISRQDGRSRVIATSVTEVEFEAP